MKKERKKETKRNEFQFEPVPPVILTAADRYALHCVTVYFRAVLPTFHLIKSQVRT